MDETAALDEIGLFVLWPAARREQNRIVEDVRKHAQIVAAYEADWPEGISAAAGYARFYGPLLPDAVGKVKRAGSGKFFVMIVRLPRARRELRMTQRGHESVNVAMYDMKWNYRRWSGGLHTVHGTLTPEETRRDLMMLTGHSAGEWLSGAASPENAEVLPGRNGWRDMRTLFGFLKETMAYVVMRNAEELPDRLDPEHGDVDILAADAKWCASLVNARKSPGGEAAYAVRVAGVDVHFDIREPGDGYYCEKWERDLLERRVLDADGIYEPAPRDAFFSLLYHILFMKRTVASGYCRKLPSMAEAAGVDATGFGQWWELLERHMADNGYFFQIPRDRTVRLIAHRVDFRNVASEARTLFATSGERPVVEYSGSLDFSADMDGGRVRVSYRPGEWDSVRQAHGMQLAFWSADDSLSARPILCHVARGGGFLVTEVPRGVPLGILLSSGYVPSAAQAARIAADAQKIVAALDASGIVHRNITAERIRVSPDGSLSLDGFEAAIDRAGYKTEPQYMRKAFASRLVPLGGDGVPRPGEWNDRYALAQALKPLAGCGPIGELVSRLESEALSGKGSLRVCLRKLSVRILALYVEIVLRGLLSPRRRKSAAFVRVRRFARNALFG